MHLVRTLQPPLSKFVFLQSTSMFEKILTIQITNSDLDFQILLTNYFTVSLTEITKPSFSKLYFTYTLRTE